MSKEQVLRECITNTLVLKSLAGRSDFDESFDQLLESLQSWIEELRG